MYTIYRKKKKRKPREKKRKVCVRFVETYIMATLNRGESNGHFTSLRKNGKSDSEGGLVRQMLFSPLS